MARSLIPPDPRLLEEVGDLNPKHALIPQKLHQLLQLRPRRDRTAYILHQELDKLPTHLTYISKLAGVNRQW